MYAFMIDCFFFLIRAILVFSETVLHYCILIHDEELK